MNVLILTGKFGFGHLSAAEAIKEKLLQENPNYNIQIIDFIDYMFPHFNKLIYKTFNILVGKCSGVYNLLNKRCAELGSVPLKKVVVKKIDNLLNKNQVKMVISVLPVCSQYISAYKKKVNNNVILNTCITDIYVHDEWITEGTNYYFVGSNETKQQLIRKGVAKDKIIVSGIPVKSSFQAIKHVNKKKKILIMGGGLGLIPSIDSFLSFLNANEHLDVTVIAGNNKKLYENLKNNFNNIRVIGFTSNVDKYMKKADLIISKAGGITMFEAINTLTPLFIIKPFLMQEVGNAKYIENTKIGKVIWDNKENIYEDIMDVINNPEALEVMKKNMIAIKSSLKNVSFKTFYDECDLKC